MDKSGHGTSVAGVAAGNNGVAYKSDIIVVKLGEDNFFSTARLMEGVDFALKFAMENNRPIAINISIGNNFSKDWIISIGNSALNFAIIY